MRSPRASAPAACTCRAAATEATLLGQRISEVPTTLRPDGRSRPHPRSWRDGWGPLRFLLLYSPRWPFLYPGAVLMRAGVLGAVAAPGPAVG